MDSRISKRLETAVVRFTKKGGQGFLVAGNFILTAAHCLDEFDCEGGMVLGDYYIEEIETSLGKLKVAPLAVEPVNDIAVLGALDNQEFEAEVDAFENFCRRVKPLALSRKRLPRQFPICVYSHERRFIEGIAMQFGHNMSKLSVQTHQQIHVGTSGGPIFDYSGEVVGICSNFSLSDSKGTAPRPNMALPTWVCRQIFR